MITHSNSIWSCRLIFNKLIKHILRTIAFHNSLVQGVKDILKALAKEEEEDI